MCVRRHCHRGALSPCVCVRVCPHRYKPLPLYCVQAFADQLCWAVAFLHALDLTHTDLKPENLLLAPATFLESTARTSTRSRGAVLAPSTTTMRCEYARVFLLLWVCVPFPHGCACVCCVRVPRLSHMFTVSVSRCVPVSRARVLPSSCSVSPRVCARCLTLSPRVCSCVHPRPVIDFGGATFENQHKSSIINTRQYRAPEVVLDCGWDTASDMWSVGCILMEMYTGELLFATVSECVCLRVYVRVCVRAFVCLNVSPLTPRS